MNDLDLPKTRAYLDELKRKRGEDPDYIDTGKRMRILLALVQCLKTQVDVANVALRKQVRAGDELSPDAVALLVMLRTVTAPGSEERRVVDMVMGNPVPRLKSPRKASTTCSASARHLRAVSE
jgi:hypothetical protein